MRREEHYIWRTLWNGRMTPTRYHCTEEFIRKSHPEAVRVDNSLIVKWIPETHQEIAAQERALQAVDGYKPKEQ
mgnify:CR=1 FL=1